MICADHQVINLIAVSIYKYLRIGITILAKSTPMIYRIIASLSGRLPWCCHCGCHVPQGRTWLLARDRRAVEGLEALSTWTVEPREMGRGGSVIYCLRLGAVRRHRCSANYATQGGRVSQTPPPIVAKIT